jgi:hypothetical protein
MKTETGRKELGRNVTAYLKQSGFNTHFPLATGLGGIVVGSVEEFRMLGHSLRGNYRGVPEVIGITYSL